MPTRNLTIMFTDIKGFTERTSRETRHGIVNYIEKHNNLLLPVIRHYGGTVVKTIGDAFLVHFDSPTDGVLCGLTIQEVLRQYNANTPSADERVNVRVAINVGDVELKDNDVLGEPVNVAARLEGITEAGDVYFTEAVYLAMNRKEVPSTEIGERTFAGISQPIRIYKVIQDEASTQHRKIAQSVQWRNGLPVLSGKPIAASSTATAAAVAALPAAKQASKAGVLVAGVAVVAIVLFTQIMLRNNPPSEKPAAPPPLENSPVQKAEKLLAAGEALSAFEAADKYLLEQPEDAKAREIAIKGAGQHLETLIARDGNEVALAWIKPLAERRQYLAAGLGSKFSALDAEVTTVAALHKHRTTFRYYEEIQKLLKKYPQDPDVPYTVAVVMKRSIMPEVLLWLFKESIVRGRAADATMFECIAVTLKRNLPESDYAKEAHELAGQHFAADAERWALEILEKSPPTVADDAEDVSLLNALRILETKQHAAAQDAFYQSLRALPEGKRLAEIQQALLENKEPRKNRQALLLVQSLINESNIKPDIRDSLRPMLTQLKQKDGGF